MRRSFRRLRGGYKAEAVQAGGMARGQKVSRLAGAAPDACSGVAGESSATEARLRRQRAARGTTAVPRARATRLVSRPAASLRTRASHSEGACQAASSVRVPHSDVMQRGECISSR